MNGANTQPSCHTFTERAEQNTALLCRWRQEKKINGCKSDIRMAAADLEFKAEETD